MIKPEPKGTEPSRPIEFEAPDGQTRPAGDGAARKRRRPSGEPPPLPRPLRTSGKVMLAYMGLLLVLLLIVGPAGLDVKIDRWDSAVLRWIAGFRTPAVTTVMQGIAAVLGSTWLLAILRWGALIALVALKRFRHLFVFFGSICAVGLVTTSISMLAVRARPFGVAILGDWLGSSLPSRPVAAFTVTLLGITYSFFVHGRPRNLAKIGLRVLVLLLVIPRLYLGIDHPLDVIMAVGLASGIAVVAFRLLAPNEVFPVTYGGGRSAHLDIGGKRGEAIRQALEQQLGISVIDMKPFGLAGSGGSTPLRLRVAGDPDYYLFAKLYAQHHLRADRWYKIGRTLLYGRLEDEAAFSTVRRLVQYEDYMMRVMRDAGVHVPRPYGFVEITPEREYLLVTSFVEGAKESLDAEIDDRVIDGALSLVRSLWDAGLAHRDIKPSNILIRDGQVHLIDVAFGEIRPSPWREAVDLANMMLVLAIGTDPDRVYARAVHHFSPDEIAEAFAATRGVTMPSQSRNLIRKAQQDLLERFRELAPPRPPIRIQRWSVRRVGLTAGVLLACILSLSVVFGNVPGAGLLPSATEQAFARVGRPPECGRFQGEALFLEAQSVPSASLVPCLNALPLGWTFGSLYVRNGSSVLSLNSDRAGLDAVRVTLRARCNTSGADEVPSDEPGARRSERIESLSPGYSGSRYYVFDGGCVVYRFSFSDDGPPALTNDVSLALGFNERAELEERVKRATGLEL